MIVLVVNAEPFEEITKHWSSYIKRFEYVVLTNKIKRDVIVPTFLSVMGGKTFNLLHSLVQLDKPGDMSYNEIVTILANYYSPMSLIITERFRFYKLNQDESTSISQFIAALKCTALLSEHCEFGLSLNDTICDRNRNDHSLRLT